MGTGELRAKASPLGTVAEVVPTLVAESALTLLPLGPSPVLPDVGDSVGRGEGTAQPGIWEK